MPKFNASDERAFFMFINLAKQLDCWCVAVDKVQPEIRSNWINCKAQLRKMVAHFENYLFKINPMLADKYWDDSEKISKLLEVIHEKSVTSEDIQKCIDACIGVMNGGVMVSGDEFQHLRDFLELYNKSNEVGQNLAVSSLMKNQKISI